jgi:glycosyltransferase involved in cell wall biosynthesis
LSTSITPFSVLMSIYHGTRSNELRECLSSLVQQTRPATEIVLVRDGPVSKSVENCIREYESTIPFLHLHYPENRGLGAALHDGLDVCSHELVARVDSDDVSINDRFRIQTKFLNENPLISVVGGGLREWYPSKGRPKSAIRNGPCDPSLLPGSAKFRNPLNHPTAMYRKTDVLACGNYQPCPLFEDYLLWGKMIASGYRITNLPVVLVETNIDEEYFRRRGGLHYIKKEYCLAVRLYQIGFLTSFEALRFISLRAPFRLPPLGLRKYFYRTKLRTLG